MRKPLEIMNELEKTLMIWLDQFHDFRIHVTKYFLSCELESTSPDFISLVLLYFRGGLIFHLIPAPLSRKKATKM